MFCFKKVVVSESIVKTHTGISQREGLKNGK